VLGVSSARGKPSGKEPLPASGRGCVAMTGCGRVAKGLRALWSYRRGRQRACWWLLAAVLCTLVCLFHPVAEIIVAVINDPIVC